MTPADEQEEEGLSGDFAPDPSESLEFEKVKPIKRKRGGLTKMLSAIVVLAAAAGGGWYFYGDKLMPSSDENIPVIRAAEGPVKVRPENPGGMAIPNRDKEIYSVMNGGEKNTRVERLLPAPETPLAPPAPEPEAVSEQQQPEPEPQKVEKVVEKAPAPLKLEPKTKTTTVETPEVKVPKVEEPKVAAPVVKTPPPPPKPEPVVEKKPQAAPKPEDVTKTIASMVYRVQLAAVRTREGAEKEWKRLRKKHADLLGKLSLTVVRADLGKEKGVFFRLRAGPMAGEKEARDLCKKLAVRKVGCLMVRPGG